MLPKIKNLIKDLLIEEFNLTMGLKGSMEFQLNQPPQFRLEPIEDLVAYESQIQVLEQKADDLATAIAWVMGQSSGK